MTRPPKASDVSDEVFLRAVVAVQSARFEAWITSPGYSPRDLPPAVWGPMGDGLKEYGPGILDVLTAWPRKVLEAKARRLIGRGLLDGCVCGCRGDFELTAKGRELLGLPAEPSTAQRFRALAERAAREAIDRGELTLEDLQMAWDGDFFGAIERGEFDIVFTEEAVEERVTELRAWLENHDARADTERPESEGDPLDDRWEQLVRRFLRERGSR